MNNEERKGLRERVEKLLEEWEAIDDYKVDCPVELLCCHPHCAAQLRAALTALPSSPRKVCQDCGTVESDEQREYDEDCKCGGSFAAPPASKDAPPDTDQELTSEELAQQWPGGTGRRAVKDARPTRRFPSTMGPSEHEKYVEDKEMRAEDAPTLRELAARWRSKEWVKAMMLDLREAEDICAAELDAALAAATPQRDRLFDSDEPCPRCGEPLSRHEHSRAEGCTLRDPLCARCLHPESYHHSEDEHSSCCLRDISYTGKNPVPCMCEGFVRAAAPDMPSEER